MVEWFSAEQISNTLGVPLGNVQTNLAGIMHQMEVEGLTQRPDMIAVLATIGVEVPNFLPIPEWGTGWEYEGRSDLGNIYSGDGPRYKGRGFIQLTGRANYQHYGEVLGLDLVGNPDLALDPGVASLILARYFVERGTADYARAGNWSEVRITVNGGLNGWSRFWSIVVGLSNLPVPQQPGPSQPPVKPPAPLPRQKEVKLVVEKVLVAEEREDY